MDRVLWGHSIVKVRVCVPARHEGRTQESFTEKTFELGLEECVIEAEKGSSKQLPVPRHRANPREQSRS